MLPTGKSSFHFLPWTLEFDFLSGCFQVAVDFTGSHKFAFYTDGVEYETAQITVDGLLVSSHTQDAPPYTPFTRKSLGCFLFFHTPEYLALLPIVNLRSMTI